MATAREIIKQWFENFKKPTQEHFWAWIDSFWHKNEKIPMSSVQNLEQSLQNVVTSDQFNNHINDGNAHQALFDSKLDKGTYTGNAKDLESAINHKVDKVDGKGLSTNDFTNSDKQKLDDTADKVIVSGAVTGEVNKILTLTYSDGTALHISFQDLGIDNIADIMLNSLNFNFETGVLTGLRSDGQQLTVNLDGRYSLLDHHHDDLYAKKTHTHSEFALRTHQHNWDDIQHKPTNLATTQFVGQEIDKIKVGGRNLLRDIRYWNKQKGQIIGVNVEAPNKSNTAIRIKLTPNEWDFYANVNVDSGGDYIFSGWVKLETTTNFLIVVNNTFNANNIYVKKEITGSGWQRFEVPFVLNGDRINLHVGGYAHSIPERQSAGDVLVWNLQLEKGNKSTDGKPAPEDMVSKTEIENVIDVSTINNAGDFKPKVGNLRPHVSNNGDFSIFTGEIGSGELQLQVNNTRVTAKKELDTPKVTIHSPNLSRIALDSRNNELNVCDYTNENNYFHTKAKGYKTPTGTANEVLRADGSTAFFMKGVDVHGGDWGATNGIMSGTIFLKGSGDKNIRLHQLENHTILSFKKCYNGGVIIFTCTGKTIIMRGANAFNGADGSNAVISIVDNKCYIDINNY
ncbi:phage head spike fiber domain-containing protein [Capnocytophaga canis]|uniref:phage head spike fiber domain-containing protein n=1 Tax=Capnocytophaga canis TaxID=1848903 RepID=UPI0037CF3AD6